MTRGIGRGHVALASVAAVVLIAAMSFTAWSFYRLESEQCLTRDVTLDVLRDILTDARTSVATNPAYPAAERNRRVDTYDSYLQRVKDARC